MNEIKEGLVERKEKLKFSKENLDVNIINDLEKYNRIYISLSYAKDIRELAWLM